MLQVQEGGTFCKSMYRNLAKQFTSTSKYHQYQFKEHWLIATGKHQRELTRAVHSQLREPHEVTPCIGCVRKYGEEIAAFEYRRPQRDFPDPTCQLMRTENRSPNFCLPELCHPAAVLPADLSQQSERSADPHSGNTLPEEQNFRVQLMTDPPVDSGVGRRCDPNTQQELPK